MEKLSEFKNFVKKHPELIKHVNNKETTWQNLYETWNLYGEDNNETWRKYLTLDSKTDLGLTDIVNSLKKVNMDSVVKGINNIQKVISLFQTSDNDKLKSVTKEPYMPRPMYKHFDD